MKFLLSKHFIFDAILSVGMHLDAVTPLAALHTALIIVN